MFLNKSGKSKLEIIVKVVQQGLGARVMLSRRLNLPLTTPNANQAIMKLIASPRKHAMRNFARAARNMTGLTRPIIPWIVAGTPMMDRSNLPIP